MLEIIKQAYKDVRDRIKNPFTENNATPFAGTFLIVLVLYNWELIFSILNFDRTTTRSQKIRIISEFVNQQDWFTEFKLTISYTLALILFYAFFSNISLIITTFFNSWFKPAILKFIDRNKITTKKEYNDLLAHVDMLNKQLGELEDFSMKSQAKHTMQIEDKDKKERVVKLSPSLLVLLPKYYEKYKPYHFIIEGQKGKAYSEKGVQQVIKTAALRAGIISQVTPHCLRHCFATHLLESGMDIRYVQELLGHQSVKSTENYNHTSDISKINFQSPLDLL